MDVRENLYIILVNYCNPCITVDCITSLKKTGIEMSHIIVVDNSSPDDSLEVLKDIEGIILIPSKKNGGFSYGNNIGIKYALEHDCTCVILLNNDTIVAEDFLDKIFEDDGTNVTVPKIYYYSDPKILWYAGGRIDYKKGLQVHFGDGLKDAPRFSKQIEVDYATGCCMMIPRTVLDKVGLLDENYFMYWEDMDYSLRLKNSGIKIHYLPEAKIWHKVGMSGGSQSKMAIYYSNRNRFFLLKKFKFGKKAWVYALTTRLWRYLHSLITKSNDRVIKRAWHDYRNGIMGKVDI